MPRYKNAVMLLNVGQETRSRAAPVRLPHVLYLAGVGRTGSTLLGQTLGYIPGAIFVGELSQFWHRFASSELCSCGQALPDCQFWSTVISEGFGELKAEDARILGELEWRLRLRQSISSLLPMRRKTTIPKRFQAIADARARLYCSIASVAQADWVVDSGKDPWIGAIIGRLCKGNFGAVHIVRDPRGVAFSWAKLVKSDSEPGFMLRRHPAKVATSWLVRNLVIQFTLRHLSAFYVRVRYEDLATDPEAVVREIAHPMGIRADLFPVKESREGLRYDLHWVAGNPGVRQSSRSPLKIKLDEEWRDRLPQVQRWLVTIICGALLPFYGYPLSYTGKARLHSRWSLSR